MNLKCSPQVRRRLRLPCFYGRPFPVVYRLLVPARHAKKWPNSTRKPKSQAAAWNFTNSCQITKINSAQKCPITEPKNCTWSLLLSSISYYTHDLQIRGHPQVLARQLKTVPMGYGVRGRGWEEGERGWQETSWRLLSSWKGEGGKANSQTCPVCTVFPSKVHKHEIILNFFST